jgi:hypothetical protein
MITAQTIKTEDARKINDKLAPAMRYIVKLYERMEKAGCPSDDSFRIALTRAYDAMQDLATELHYMSCKEGVGRPSKE